MAQNTQNDACSPFVLLYMVYWFGKDIKGTTLSECDFEILHCVAD